MRTAAVLAIVASAGLGNAADDLRSRALETLRRAAEFYRAHAAVEGGYQFAYTADMRYGRSEIAEGLAQISVQRQGTPTVGITFLEAYRVTGERFFLEAARDAARALVRGQLCSGGWHYVTTPRCTRPGRASSNLLR